ncbi:ThuA domain-containing protein [Rubritalea spongiae]|uniref:ThuA domain-containing protein n=1 Tax=Rubritalea spongiae TaxID=430797 RepID=A0ABW5E512_9BACT
MKKLSTCILFSIGLFSSALAEKKNILIIYGKSTHQNYAHNNEEVATLLKTKFDNSEYAEKFVIETCLNYPSDLSKVENADLVIISSDGGPKHALFHKKDPTNFTKHFDSVIKKNKTGVIMVHWATDAPSPKFGGLHKENAQLMQDWIGAVYYWVNKGKSPESSWTWKFPVMEFTVNKEHPISNGLPETFKLQDEYYYNFFTEGADSRNPKNDKVTYIHSSKAPSTRDDIEDETKWREQPTYWTYDREDGGRSVGLTSAHFYHTWANPHFFKTFTNSVLWTLNEEVPENGAAIPTPTLKELLAVNKKAAIYMKAEHFK